MTDNGYWSARPSPDEPQTGPAPVAGIARGQMDPILTMTEADMAPAALTQSGNAADILQVLDENQSMQAVSAMILMDQWQAEVTRARANAAVDRSATPNFSTLRFIAGITPPSDGRYPKFNDILRFAKQMHGSGRSAEWPPNPPPTLAAATGDPAKAESWPATMQASGRTERGGQLTLLGWRDCHWSQGPDGSWQLTCASFVG